MAEVEFVVTKTMVLTGLDGKKVHLAFESAWNGMEAWRTTDGQRLIIDAAPDGFGSVFAEVFFGKSPEKKQRANVIKASADLMPFILQTETA